MQVMMLERHTLYREAMSTLLESLDQEITVYPVASVREASELYGRAPGADLAVIGTDPGRDGPLEAIRSLRRIDDKACIAVVLSATGPEEAFLYGEGAMTCIPSDASGDAFVSALRHALSQGYATRRAARQAPARPVVLTRRQREILTLIARGLRNRDMGQILGVSEGTVKVHVSAILRTLDAGNRVQALAAARRMGLVA